MSGDEGQSSNKSELVALVAERRHKVCIVAVSYALHAVIVKEVKQIDAEINRDVVNQEEGQISVHGSRVLLTQVQDHYHEKEQAKSCQ